MLCLATNLVFAVPDLPREPRIFDSGKRNPTTPVSTGMRLSWKVRCPDLERHGMKSAVKFHV
jgi:hypothetical protein